MLQRERDTVRANFQDSLTARGFAIRPPKAWVEKASIVHSKFPRPGIIGHHLSGHLPGHAHIFACRYNEERAVGSVEARVAPTVLAPNPRRAIIVDLGHIDDAFEL